MRSVTPDGRPESWRELWRMVRADPVRRRNAAVLALSLGFAAVIVLAAVAFDLLVLL